MNSRNGFGCHDSTMKIVEVLLLFFIIGPTQVYLSNGTSISSSVFVGLTVMANRHPRTRRPLMHRQQYAVYLMLDIAMRRNRVKVKVKYRSTDAAVVHCNTATGTHVPQGMGSQCYLPPGRGDIPAFTQAKAGTRFSDPGRM